MGLLHWNTQLHLRQCSPLYPAADCDVDNAGDGDGGGAAVAVAVAAAVVSSEALVVNSDYIV